MTSMGYTTGRCIYCGKPLYKPEGIACVRHKMLPAKDPLVPRPDPGIESPPHASEEARFTSVGRASLHGDEPRMKKDPKAKRLGRGPSPAERATQRALELRKGPPDDPPLRVSTFPGVKAKALPGQLAITDTPE